MVLHLARVTPGVIIPSDRKVLPGKNVESQEEIDAKTAKVDEFDEAFMNGVIDVNVAFAEQYPVLAEEDQENVFGINFDPGHTDFNPDRDLPTLAGVPTRDPIVATKYCCRANANLQRADSAELVSVCSRQSIT